jgi:hypothetical protein
MVLRSSGASFMNGEVLVELMALFGSSSVFGAIVVWIVDCSIAANTIFVVGLSVQFVLLWRASVILPVMSCW